MDLSRPAPRPISMSDLSGFQVHEDASPITTPPLRRVSAEEGRLDEWIVDSGALVADAFTVRRLIRLHFEMWRRYMNRIEAIGDALFTAQQESDTKMQVRVFLGLTKVVQWVRREESNAHLTSRMTVRNLKKASFKNFLSLFHRVVRLRNLEREKRVSNLQRAVQGWHRVAVPFRGLKLVLEKKRALAQKSTSFAAFVRARISGHLDFIQQLRRMEQFRVRRVLRQLKTNVLFRERGRAALEISNSRKKKKCMHAFFLAVRGHREEFNRLFPPSNRLGPYLLYKLAGEVRCVHASHAAGASVRVACSLVLAALLKWRVLARSERVSRGVKNGEVRAAVWTCWRGRVAQSRSMRLGEAIFREEKKIQIQTSSFRAWKMRWTDRLRLRKGLDRFVAKQESTLLAFIGRKWSEVSRSQRRLLCARQIVERGHQVRLLGQLRLGRVRGEMSVLHARRSAGFLLLRFWKSAVAESRIARRLERKGALFWRNLVLGRWRSVLVARRETRRFLWHSKAARDCALVAAVFRFWSRRVRVATATRSAETRKIDSLKRIAFATLAAQRTARKRKALAEVLGSTVLQKSAFRSIRRFCQARQFVRDSARRSVARRLWVDWRRIVALATVFHFLEKIRHRFLLDESMVCMHASARSQRSVEIAKTEWVVVRRVGGILREWRLLGQFVRFVRLRAQRNEPGCSMVVGREILRKWRLTAKVAEIGRVRGEMERGRVLRCVLFERKSRWVVETRAARIRRQRYTHLLVRGLQVWRDVYFSSLETELELLGLSQQLALRVRRRLFLDWKFAVRNKRMMVGQILFAWHSICAESLQVRHAFVALFSTRVSRMLSAGFLRWQTRLTQRSQLKSGLFALSAHYAHRLVLGVLVGLARHADERKRARTISKKFNPKRILLDRWIRGTVTLIALREVGIRVKRVCEKFAQRCAVSALRNHARIVKFVAARARQTTLVAARVDEGIARDCLLGWRRVVGEKAELSSKLFLVWKHRFFSNLTAFAVSKIRARQLEIAAAELLVARQAQRLTNLIDTCVAGWRRLVEYEAELEAKREILQKIYHTQLLAAGLGLWRTLRDVGVYRREVLGVEAELVVVFEFRVKTRCFNKWILAFLEHAKLDKAATEAAIDFATDRLLRKAMLRFVQNRVSARNLRWIAAGRVRKVLASTFYHLLAEQRTAGPAVDLRRTWLLRKALLGFTRNRNVAIPYATQRRHIAVSYKHQRII